MNSKNLMLAFTLMLTFASITQAYLIPGGQTGSGKPNNDPNRPGQYYPPPQQGGGHNGGGGYYPPPQHNGDGGGHHGGGNHGGGGYYPPPNNGGGHNGGGYYPPPPQPPPSYYPPPPPPNYYPPQPPPPYYGQRIVQQVYVGRPVANETLQLSYLAQLNTQYYGWEVTAVRASTRPNSPYQTLAQLITANRVVVASQVNPGYQIALFPNYHVIAGYQDLYLVITGSTYIDSIEVELVRQ